MDVAVADLDSIYTTKEDQKTSTESFSWWTTFSLYCQLVLARVSPQHLDLISPLPLIGGPADLAAANPIGPLERETVRSPSKFCLLFLNAFCGIFSKWTREIQPKDFGKVPPAKLVPCGLEWNIFRLELQNAEKP